MASGDATPFPKKNAAYRITFPIFDNDGDLVTGAASLDSEVSLDGGTFSDVTAEATEIATASGMYFLDLTADEMNADTVTIIIKTSTGDAKTTPIVIHPRESGDLDVTLEPGDADIAAVKAETALIVADTSELQVDNVPGLIAALDTDVAADIAAVKAETALIVADTSELQVDNVPGLIATLDTDVAADIAAVKADTAAVLVDTADIQPKIGTPSANVSADIAAVKVQTAAIEADTAGLAGAAMRGTNNAALASVCTEPRLAELSSANLPTDIAAVKADTAAVLVDTADIQPKLGTPAVDLAADIAAVKAETALIVADTNELQVDNVPGLISALNNLSASGVNAEIVDVIRTDVLSQLSQGAPPSTPSLATAMMYVYQYLRNKREQTSSEVKMYDDAGTEVIAKATISDDGTTASKGEFVTGP